MTNQHRLRRLSRHARPARREAEFLFTESVTAQAYGIARRRHPLGRGCGRGRAPARCLRRGRLGPRPPRRPAAGEPARLPAALVRAQRAGRERGADQCRDALGRIDLPHRPQRDRPGRDPARARRRSARRGSAGGRALRDDGRGRSRAARRPRPRRVPAQPIGEGTECALLYTSGTTGRPKGCMLDNAYFLRAGEWYAALDGVCSIRAGRRARHHAAAAQPHERDGVLDHGGAGRRRLPGAARPLPPQELAGERARERRHHRPLPGRDAGDAAVGAGRVRRPRRTRSAGASAPAWTARTTHPSRRASASRWSRPGP